jgi:hypothetical protein
MGGGRRTTDTDRTAATDRTADGDSTADSAIEGVPAAATTGGRAGIPG